MFLEFYAADGTWLGAAVPGEPLRDELVRANRVVFEGRIEIVSYDEDGSVVEWGLR